MRTAKQITIFVSAVCITTYVQAQGNLTPPGAPAPTMKTLQQIEPRVDAMTLAGDAQSEIVITSPGSYYLSANLEVNKGDGIRIFATSVTLDLNGFEIRRISGGGAGVDNGINLVGGSDRVKVINGTIVGFSYGIRSYYPNPKGCLFEKLTVTECANYGIEGGESTRIIDCIAHDNPGIGILALAGSIISGCAAYGNQGTYGIYAGDGSTISACTVSYHPGVPGSYGIYARNGSTVSGCTVNDSQVSRAIYAGSGSTIKSCSAYNNEGSYGIYASSGSTISDCLSYNNQVNYGIYQGGGGSVNRCSSYSNDGYGNSSYGIYAANDGMVVECSASYNSNTNSQSTSLQGVGISVGWYGTIKDCTSSLNRGDGIRVSGRNLVEGNTCISNGNSGDGAGIHVIQTDNRIDGNTVTTNDRGIDVDVAGNLIIRNSASGNTTANYDWAGTQTIGPIITATGTITSTNPWANFLF